MATKARAAEDEANGLTGDDAKMFDLAVDQLAKVTGRSKQAITEALNNVEGEELKIDPDAPPFHRSVCWADIKTPDGISVHVVARSGETVEGLLQTVLTMGETFNVLLSEHGYLTGAPMPGPRVQASAPEPQAPRAPAGPRRAPRPSGGRTPRHRGGSSNGHSAQGEATDDIKVIQIVKTISGPSNQILYRVQGGNWMEHGVSCWPDSGNIEQLADIINLDAWEVGQTVQIDDLDVYAIYTLKRDGNPGKVIAWDGEDVIPLLDVAVV